MEYNAFSVRKKNTLSVKITTGPMENAVEKSRGTELEMLRIPTADPGTLVESRHSYGSLSSSLPRSVQALIPCGVRMRERTDGEKKERGVKVRSRREKDKS